MMMDYEKIESIRQSSAIMYKPMRMSDNLMLWFYASGKFVFLQHL